MTKRFAVGITGATGAILAKRLVEELLKRDFEVHLTSSNAGRMVIRDELGGKQGGSLLPNLEHENLVEWNEKNYYAPFASGSAPFDGMAIIPCTMSTAAAIAHGITDNLLRRGADVMLKEKRPLVVVPREAPLSLIHLRNLTTLAEVGATIIPPMLSFYQSPGDDVAAQVDFTTSRVLDHLGVDNDLIQRWGQA